MAELIFPENFTWGAATASYQIEGAYNEDGRGESIWDRFTHKRGNILNNDTGDTACDHYHRYKEDINIMKDLGLDSYRFSISWPRIFPEGGGQVNQKGLDFYKRLVYELLNAGISPSLTLYHWDLPQALQETGGWANRDTIKYFNEFADIIFRELGDVIPAWITHNEPFVIAFLGHLYGMHAPGMKDYQIALQVAHNIMVSHGLVVKNFRNSGGNGEIGITLDMEPVYPISENENDKRAAELRDAFKNRWFLDPIFKGEYPEELYNLYQSNIGDFRIEPGDMELINQEIDFLGINYYTRSVVKYDQSEPLYFSGVNPEERQCTDITEIGWEVYPAGIYELLKRLNEDYTDKPLYITENGAAFDDRISEDGKIHDQNRIDYLKDHFRSAYQAVEEGVPLRGYYLWSLMDNFEWSHGYSKRFGITYIDYEDNRKRILKDSAGWYKQVIQRNGIEV